MSSALDIAKPSRRQRAATWYVYVLRDEHGRPFYVGKGSGARAMQHLLSDDPAGGPVKTEIIARIKELGRLPDIEFAGWFSDEKEAFGMEADLIEQYGSIHNGTGSLANIQRATKPLPVKIDFDIADELRALMERYRLGPADVAELLPLPNPKQGGRVTIIRWLKREHAPAPYFRRALRDLARELESTC